MFLALLLWRSVRKNYLVPVVFYITPGGRCRRVAMTFRVFPCTGVALQLSTASSESRVFSSAKLIQVPFGEIKVKYCKQKESDKPMSDLCVTMQSCLAAVKNLNSCGMNLYPALRAVRWQAEKYNIESLCVSPAL